MSAWKLSALGEYATVQTGPFGSQLHAADYLPAGVPVVMPQDLGDNTISTAQIARVGESDAERLGRHRLRPGDIVFSRRGDVTRRSLVRSENDGWLCGTGCLRVKPHPTADGRFLSYALGAFDAQEWLIAHAVGATMPNLNTEILGRVPLQVPPLVEQQAIAEVLGALDDKIAANTKLIDLLLTVVNTEFVRRFGDRSLEVTVGTLAEVVDCLHSKKPERMPDGATLMQLNNIRDDGLVERTLTYCISAEDYVEWSRRFETRAWDLVITNVGRIGAVARIPDGYVAALGRNMTGIRPKVAAESGSFISAALLSSAVRREIDRRTDPGSVMSALNVRSVPLLRLQGSSPSERSAFHEFASPFFENADTALSENACLAASRDALLPHLMSGKLRVRDAERAVGEVL